MNKGYITRSVLAAGMILLLAGASSCSKGKSYSELLRDEEKATNWYLSGQRVETGIPKDSVLQTGSDAPFYRLDKDGYVYMQVVELGDTSDMADPGDLVYFRFMRRNLLQMYDGQDVIPEGNADDMASGLGTTSFVYGNTELSGTTTWGTGIQMPLQMVGNHSEVNLVLRSYYGFQVDQADCIPYIINIKYFKAEY